MDFEYNAWRHYNWRSWIIKLNCLICKRKAWDPSGLCKLHADDVSEARTGRRPYGTVN